MPCFDWSRIENERVGVPRRLEALEGSLAIDVFAPRRDDWILGA